MPIIEPDLSGVGPIEAGTYKAKIDEVVDGISKAGAPKLVVQFSVEVGNEKKVRKVHMPYSGAGAFGFDSLLRACHFEDIANGLQKKNAAERPKFDTDQLIGQELMVVIEASIYNGQPTDQINGYLRA